MKVFFLGTCSEQGRTCLYHSSYGARVTAVTAMVERACGKLGSVTYPQGKYDVIAEVEVDSVETAAGMRDVMLILGLGMNSC